MPAIESIEIEVYTNNLYPGMILKGDGYDENGNKVIDKEVPLTEDVIKRLKVANIKKIHYSRERIRNKVDVSNPMISMKNVQNAINLMQEIEGKIRSQVYNIPRKEVDVLINDFLADIKEKKDAYLNLLDLSELDEYTYTHSINASTISILIAFSLNLDESMIVKTGITGLLFDIGKMMLPRELLYKADKLNDDEWKIVRKHPVYSYNLLKSKNEFDEDILKGVLFHHEHYSGGGYPFGVNYEKTNLISQIIAVADVFDAITSKRAYKDAETVAFAFNTINEHSGTKFNPRVAQTFLKEMVRKINEKPLYEENDYVLLNTGEIAFVVGYRQSEFTLRPIVNIFYNPKRAEGKILRFVQQVDLEQDYNRRILKKITDKQQIEKLDLMRNK